MGIVTGTEVEGGDLETNVSSGVEDDFGDAPYESAKQRKVLIQPYDYAVRTLMDMIIEGDLRLDPDYQRNYRWPDEKASRFIESIALNIPVPVFYFAEETDGTFSVIDGQQRLTSIFRFLKPHDLDSVFVKADIPELVLSGLKVSAHLNGMRFQDLDRIEKSLISKRPMRCIVVLNESDETLKFEVFERLNSGSTSLTDQEVRNCLYNGSLNKMLKDLAENVIFRELLSLPAASQKNMTDVELVLRFFAYRELSDGQSYGGNYTEFLNEFMGNNRELSDSREFQMRDIFEKTVVAIYDSLGPNVAFRKPRDMETPSRSSFGHIMNGSIYESQMVAVSKLIESSTAIPIDLGNRLLSAFAVQDYAGSVLQGGTAKKSKALKRVRVLDEILAK